MSMSITNAVLQNGVVTVVDKFPEGKYFLQKSFIDFGYDLANTHTKLLEALFVVMSQHKKKDAIYRIKVKDIIKPLKLDEKNAYREIDRATHKAVGDMINWRIVIKIDQEESTGEEAWRYIPILKDATYHPGKGMVDLRINDALEQYWHTNIDEEEKIHFDIDEMYCFELVRSHKMYQVLKKYAYDTLEATFTLDQIRRFFDKQGEYPRWGDLNRRIVEPLKNDIANNGIKPKSISEFTFDYEPLKEGRAVTKVKFTLKPIEGRFKNHITPIVDVIPIEDIISLEPLQYLEPTLQQYGFYLRTLNEMAQNQENLKINPELPKLLASPEFIENLLKYLDKTYTKKGKPITGGLIRRGLINSWGQPTISEKKAENNKRKEREQKETTEHEQQIIKNLLLAFEAEQNKQFQQKKEQLTLKEIEDHFNTYLNDKIAKENGMMFEYITKSLEKNKGKRDFGIEQIFSTYLKETLLSSEENFIQWAQKQGHYNIIPSGDGYTFQMELFAG